MPRRRDDYPPDRELRSRFIRFVRARSRCEWCGAKDGEPHPATGSRVVLTTAHIYARNPMACSLLNLAALCQRCTWVMTEPSGPPALAPRRRARHMAHPKMSSSWLTRRSSSTQPARRRPPRRTLPVGAPPASRGGAHVVHPPAQSAAAIPWVLSVHPHESWPLGQRSCVLASGQQRRRRARARAALPLGVREADRRRRSVRRGERVARRCRRLHAW